MISYVQLDATKVVNTMKMITHQTRERVFAFALNQEHLHKLVARAGELLSVRGRKYVLAPAKPLSMAPDNHPRISHKPDIQSRVSMFPPHPVLHRLARSEGNESDLPSPWLRQRAAGAAAALRPGTGGMDEADALYRLTHSKDPLDLEAAELLKRGVALMLSNEREIPLARRHLAC